MAQLLSWLALSGARDNSGEPVSSGSIWFYEPGGGTTTATVYADVDGTVIASNPAALDAGGRAVIYVTSPVRVVVQDATGADVSDYDQADVIRAETVQVDNPGWSDEYLDDVLTDLYTSTGGVNGQYLESAGATARTIKSKFSELSVSVKDFGAKGDGLTVDTTAIQAAINRVEFLGGGEVYFPPGTYLIDQTLRRGVIDGVHIRGAGAGVSIIKNTSGTANAITCANSSGGSFSDLSVSASTASTGIGIDLAVMQSGSLTRVSVTGHYTAISTTGTSLIFNGVVTQAAAASAATGRGVVLSVASKIVFVGGGLSGSGDSASYGLDLKSSAADVTTVGTSIDRLNLDTTLTGSRFNIIDPGGVVLIYGGTAMPSGLRVTGLPASVGTVDGYKGGLLTGATFTPNLTQGSNITIDATTTGSAYTIAVPTPPPPADDYGVFVTLTFWAHAGGAITGWGLAAGYHVSSAPSTVDTHKTTYRLHWDPDNAVWREVSRSDTT